jgi:hypothetical protein
MVCQRPVNDLAVWEERRLVTRERRVCGEEEGGMVVAAEVAGFI